MKEKKREELRYLAGELQKTIAERLSRSKYAYDIIRILQDRGYDCQVKITIDIGCRKSATGLTDSARVNLENDLKDVRDTPSDTSRLPSPPLVPMVPFERYDLSEGELYFIESMLKHATPVGDA